MALKTLPNHVQIAFADLTAQAFDAEFDDAFPENGRFDKRRVKQRDYWYYAGYERSPEGTAGKKTQRYVGPVDNLEITARVERFREIRTSYRARREIASGLRIAGLPFPSAVEGNVLAALAREGLFRRRAVLVGSLAFQTYSGLLGVSLEGALYRTEDVDIAQDHGISVETGEHDPVEAMADILRRIDPSFRPVPHLGKNSEPAAFRTPGGFKIEFLTPNRGSAEIEGNVSSLPALGVAATPLRFLDFLIRQPCRSALLHDAGIPVLVPTPERYAIHKLIVSRRRSLAGLGAEKAKKDIDQADAIIRAKHHLRTGQDLGFAWIEAFERGPTWRHLLEEGAMLLTSDGRAALGEGVQQAARLERIEDWMSFLPWQRDGRTA